MTHYPAGTGAPSLTSGPRVSYTVPTTHRVAWVPRHESRPYRPSPARREHIYGRIQPMDEPAFPLWAVWLGLAILAPFVASFVGGR
jgi:hypothetical protein